jgi:SAM-dependent methyltransferase
MSLMKGAHYRSEFLYDALAFLKLGSEYSHRYQIAARYIKPGESVLDVCSGAGKLKSFIPENCTYTAMDASPEFLAILKKKGVKTIIRDLHAGWPPSIPVADVLTMVIALSQFRETSADDLLESFKKAARHVVVVEDVLRQARGKGSLTQRVMNYLCATDYYKPVASWYTRLEFEQLMREHGYQCETVSSRYMVGLYGF